MKPGFFQNEQLAELPYEARLLFVGLWCLADREGRLEDRPKRIKMHVFPADLLDVEPLLQGLADEKLIVRYEVEGLRCIWIPEFLKHQRPHVNEVPSELPMFHEEPKAPTKVASACDQGDKHFALNPDSLNPESSPLGESARARATSPVAEAETPPAGKKTATRIPADFALTPERRAVAVAERLDPERTFAKFCDYWSAKAGSSARKLDWDATWRNWCRSDADRNGAPNGAHRQGSQPRKLSAVERVYAATAEHIVDGDDASDARLALDG